MNDQSPTLEPTICADTPNVISLPVSAVGPTPSGSPIGMTTVQCGQDHVPASRSPSQARDSDSPMNGTSGPYGAVSSASASLQVSLQNRLRERMEQSGLIELRKTLSPRTTPLGRLYCQLLASAPAIAGIDFSFLPTPSAQTQQGGMRIEGGSRARATWRAHGRMPTSKAEALAMSAWLMGYPPNWLSASPTDSGTP